MTIRIVSDSTCDLPNELLTRYDITVLPAYINIGDKSYYDGLDLSRQAFYEGLATFSSHPTTAAPSAGAFAEVYDRLTEEGSDEILSIHVASSLSGILNAARLGAESSQKGARVTLFDSQQLGGGLGLLVLGAARAALSGRSMTEIVGLLNDWVPRTYVFATLDTMEFLRRSGRVSWPQFSLGTLLQIKPMVRVYKGQVESLDKIRTRKKAVQKMIDYLVALGPLAELAVLHTNAFADAQELAQQVGYLAPAGTTIPILDVTPAIGSHVGPNGLGLACITAH